MSGNDAVAELRIMREEMREGFVMVIEALRALRAPPIDGTEDDGALYEMRGALGD